MLVFGYHRNYKQSMRKISFQNKSQGIMECKILNRNAESNNPGSYGNLHEQYEG